MELKPEQYYSGLNENQFYRRLEGMNMTYAYDFVLDKKIIEFNGTYWHCDSRFYNEDYFHKYKQMTAKEIWEYDKNKINYIEKEGYKTLIIWEYDYMKNPKKVIQNCINFLKTI